MKTSYGVVIIKRIIKLLYLYFGGRKTMSKNNNMQIPTFLQKTTSNNGTVEAASLFSQSKISETTKSFNEEFGEMQELDEFDGEPVCTKNTAVENQSTTKQISQMEREALIRSIKGMNTEQLDILLDNIPIELVYNRLGRELDRNKAFMNSMKEAMTLIKTPDKQY